MTRVAPVRKVKPIAKVNRKQSQRNVGDWYRAFSIMALLSIVLLGGVGSRLAYLQVYQGAANRQLADNNRIRIIPKQPVRGTIFDRNGKILASSRLSHSVFIWPLAQTKDTWPATVKRLAKILNVPESDIRDPVEQAGYDSPTLIRVARDLTAAEITAIEEYSGQLDGVEVDIEHLRDYPNKKLAAHILGYTGELNAEELEKRRV
jgi:penicillin-binding protein 2